MSLLQTEGRPPLPDHALPAAFALTRPPRERALDRLHRATRNAARVLAVLGLGLLLCLAATIVADGLLRFFFAHPIDAVNDIGGNVAAVAVASCIPMVLVERGNIAIRLFSTFVGPRAGHIADILAAVLVEIVLIGIAWQFFLFAGQSARNGDATWMLHIPTAPFWWVVTAMISAGVLVQAVVVVEYAAGYTPAGLHDEHR
ncbi:MAG TPA: TRAP transporter small permease subunit [Hyphomicrobiales bacterium]|nr:TRAP transporter small permease subunit [Hyphomicrobiales bacterium]